MEGAPSQDRFPCQICGRQFNAEVLARHKPICSKSNVKKRTVFNMVKQRQEGTDITMVPKTRAAQKSADIAANKSSNWRSQHEEFIRTIRAARGAQAAMEAGKPLPPPPPPSINPDYVQCQYCERRFNVTAAERHIPFCKEQQMRKGLNVKAKPKSQARTTAPIPRSAASDPRTRRTGRAANKPRNGSARSSAVNKTQNTNRNNRGFDGDSDQYDSGAVSPGTGPSLRTGRNAETYSDARALSANAKMEALRKKFPSNDSIHRLEVYDAEDAGRMRREKKWRKTSHRSTQQYNTLRSPSPSGLSGGADPDWPSDDLDLRMTSFCHDCGAKYPVSNARFCCLCGVRRLTLA